MSRQRIEVSEGLDEAELLATPYRQVRSWVDAAVAVAEAGGPVAEPFAMSLATADADGRPNVRTVLMRFFSEDGPGFVSSSDSAKGHEMTARGDVAASLTWPGIHRAIRFRGRVEPLEDHLVDAYWRSRPWGARISAVASTQSAPISSRAELEAASARCAVQWPDRGGPDDVPRPATWRGWRVTPAEVEFWAGRRDRLHDRIVFSRVGAGTLDDAGAWRQTRRQP